MKSFRDERWSVRYNSNSSKACLLANRHSICICTDRDAFPQMLTGLIKSLFKDSASRESDELLAASLEIHGVTLARVASVSGGSRSAGAMCGDPQ